MAERKFGLEGVPLVLLQGVRLRPGTGDAKSAVDFAAVVDFRLDPGRHTRISGANGSGKSTLLKILTGELWPDRREGSRTFGFTGAPDPSPILARGATRRVAPEMQERFLRLRHDVTAREFILCGERDTEYLDREPAAATLDRYHAVCAQLDLCAYLDQPARRLSHGTLRRAFLARALIAQPRLLALDEALDGMDGRQRDAALRALDAAITAGTTVVWVSHADAAPPWITRRVELTAAGLRELGAAPDEGAAEPAAVVTPVQTAAVLSGAAPVVELAAVTLDCHGRRLLTDVDWRIMPGERWRLAGVNASGKSTLAAVLAGAIVPSSGTVRYGGRSARLAVADIRRRVALCSDMLQTRYDWSIPVRDVVASGWAGAVGFAPELGRAQQARLQELLCTFELERLAATPLLELSFGQRRRVFLARALTVPPQLLIMDEFFDGLDRERAGHIAVLLDGALGEATAVIVISHGGVPAALRTTHRAEVRQGRLLFRE